MSIEMGWEAGHPRAHVEWPDQNALTGAGRMTGVTQATKSKTTRDGELTVGIDLGDRFSSYCVLDGRGEVVEEGKVRTTTAGLQQRFATLGPGGVVVEVGTHSPWVSRLLEGLKHDVVVANPRRVRLIAESDAKTDRADAETLARLGRLDPRLLHPITHRGEQVQADLAVIRSRRGLVAARTLLINQVRGTVKASGTRLPTCSSHIFATKVAPAIPHELQPALFPLLSSIGELNKQNAALDAAIEQLIATRYPEASALQQVAGIGPLISLTFILTLADPARVTRSRQVGAYLGLTPRQRQSGERTPQLRISKSGDGYLRQLLVQPAHYILGHRGPDTDLRRWGLKRAEVGGANAKKRAIVAVARKLAVLLHHLWVSGEVYEPVRSEEVAL